MELVANVTQQGALYIGQFKVIDHTAVVTLTRISADDNHGGVITLCAGLNGSTVDGNLGQYSLTQQNVAATATHAQGVLAGHVITVLCIEIGKT